MAAPKFSKNNVSQKINLKDLFGVSFKGLPQLREVIGQAIIDKQLKRTARGRGMSFKGQKGTPVKLKSPYSKAYLASQDAKSFGKKPGPINMRLSGDMLELMDIKSQGGDNVTIGWDDTLENNKAFNHNVGDTVPKRPFFGVNKKELKEIKKEFKSEVSQAIRLKGDEGRKAFNEFALGLLEKIRGGS